MTREDMAKLYPLLPIPLIMRLICTNPFSSANYPRGDWEVTIGSDCYKGWNAAQGRVLDMLAEACKDEQWRTKADIQELVILGGGRLADKKSIGLYLAIVDYVDSDLKPAKG